MSRLTFADSGAMQMITAAYRVARQVGGTLALVRPTAPLIRVLELTGINQLIGVYDRVDQAITAIIQDEPQPTRPPSPAPEP